MASIDRTAYPRFKGVVPVRELNEAFTPTADEVACPDPPAATHRPAPLAPRTPRLARSDPKTRPATQQSRRRLTTRGASGSFRQIADNAGLDDQTTAHILRHTFATTLIRGGTDLVIVAELLGHSRLDTVRIYTRPTAQDHQSTRTATHRPLTEHVTAPAHLTGPENLMAPFERIPVAPLRRAPVHHGRDRHLLRRHPHDHLPAYPHRRPDAACLRDTNDPVTSDPVEGVLVWR